MADREIVLQIGKETDSECHIITDNDKWAHKWEYEGVLAFCKNERVTRVAFNNIEIFNLPECIALFPALVELDISETYIEELPESIGNLSMLEELNHYVN